MFWLPLALGAAGLAKGAMEHRAAKKRRKREGMLRAEQIRMQPYMSRQTELQPITPVGSGLAATMGGAMGGAAAGASLGGAISKIGAQQALTSRLQQPGGLPTMEQEWGPMTPQTGQVGSPRWLEAQEEFVGPSRPVYRGMQNVPPGYTGPHSIRERIPNYANLRY